MTILANSNIHVLNESLRLGKIEHAIFDFDGTISLLREGWEKIMAPVMIESICGDRSATPQVQQRVGEYIEETTGMQTILQMEGLVKMVEEFGIVAKENILDAWGYKKIYNDRLMKPVQQRIDELHVGRKTIADYTVAGSIEFCRSLVNHQITLYTASGTDQEDVRREARILGVDGYFKGGIFGAFGTVEQYSKDKVIKEILQRYKLGGPELVVFGDGPVEMRNAKENGAIAVGIASDEKTGCGWNERKIARLQNAGCDILIPDFTCGRQLREYLLTANNT